MIEDLPNGTTPNETSTPSPEPSAGEKLDAFQENLSRTAREGKGPDSPVSAEDKQREAALQAETQEKNAADSAALVTLRRNMEAQGFSFTEDGTPVPPAQPPQPWAQPGQQPGAWQQPGYQQPVQTQPAYPQQNTAIAQKISEYSEKLGLPPEDIVGMIGTVGGAMLEPVLTPMIENQLQQQVNGLALTDVEYPIYSQTLARMVAGLPVGTKWQLMNSPGGFQALAKFAASQHNDEIVRQRVERVEFEKGKVVGRFDSRYFTEGPAGKTQVEGQVPSYSPEQILNFKNLGFTDEEIEGGAKIRARRLQHE